MMTAQRNKAQRETRAGRLEKCRAERPTSAGPAVAGSRSRWLLCDYTTSIRTLLTNYLNTFKGDIPHKLRYPSRLALSGISIGRIPARRGRNYSNRIIRGDTDSRVQLKGAESTTFSHTVWGSMPTCRLMPTYESNTHTYIKRTCASWPMHQRPAVSHTKPHDNTDAGVCAEPHAPGSTPSRAPTPPRPHRPPKA